MFFENSGVGKCILLKELNPNYSLIYACNRKEFIVTTGLNKETGSWSMGSYWRRFRSSLSIFKPKK